MWRSQLDSLVTASVQPSNRANTNLHLPFTAKNAQHTQPTVAALQGMINSMEARHRMRPPEKCIVMPVSNEHRQPNGLMVAPHATPDDFCLQAPFIINSLKYADMPAPNRQPPEPPCRLPYPTLELLHEDQLLWYLWWRHQWSVGEVVPTSSNYILILSYELLNFTWRRDKAQSYRLLQRLQHDFGANPMLHHLWRWQADLAWELGFDAEAVELYERFNPGAALGARAAMVPENAVSLDVVIHWWVKHSYASKWRANHKEALCQLIYEALHDSISYFNEQKQEPLQLQLQLGQRPASWHPYSEALIQRTVYFRPIELINPDVESPIFTNFARRLENLHRLAHNERRLLKVALLPPEVEAFIETRSASWPTLVPLKSPEPEVVAVDINHALVESLLDQAYALQQTTTAWLGENPDAETQMHPIQPERTVAPALEDTAVAGTQGGAAAQAQLGTALQPNIGCDVPLLALASSLSPTERSFLSELSHTNCWNSAEAKQWARNQGVLLTTLLDAINNAWVDAYDAALIIDTHVGLTTHPDFAPELQRLLDYVKGELA